MKHYPIGTLVNFENVTLKVLAQVGNSPSCYGCYFSRANHKKLHGGTISCCELPFACTAYERRDRQHVVYVLSEKKYV